MKITDITALIEQEYPQSLQEEWDSSGLLYANDKSINKVLVCLDITNRVADYAIENDYDLIISHHPLIFGSYINSFNYIRDIFQKLYANKINMYSMHTNYDNHHDGMNTKYIESLSYKAIQEESMLKTFLVDKELLNKVKENNPFDIRIYNQRSDLNKVAVCLGAGGSFIEEVEQLNCQAFISSEFKHHEILYAQDKNIMLLDVQHQAEIIFSSKLVGFLNKNIPNLTANVYNDTYAVESLVI